MVYIKKGFSYYNDLLKQTQTTDRFTCFKERSRWNLFLLIYYMRHDCRSKFPRNLDSNYSPFKLAYSYIDVTPENLNSRWRRSGLVGVCRCFCFDHRMGRLATPCNLYKLQYSCTYILHKRYFSLFIIPMLYKY